MQHCFFNKLGHWILDMHKLLVWAVDIVSLFFVFHGQCSKSKLQKGRKTTGTRPPVLDPVFLDDMAEEPEVVGAAIRPLDTTAYNTSAALVPTVPTPTLHYNPHAPMISTTAESDNFPVFLFYTVCVWSRYPTLADNYMKVRSDLVRKVERVKYTAAEHEPELFADDRPLKA